MYAEKIDQLIGTALKNRNSVELAVWRAIKAEFLNYKTAEAGNVITDAVEAKIFKKMLAQRKDSIEQYKAAGRNDLVENETAEYNVIAELLPKEATDDEIKNAVLAAFKDIESAPSMRDMKFIQNNVKEQYPTADGKKIAEIFKSLI